METTCNAPLTIALWAIAAPLTVTFPAVSVFVTVAVPADRAPDTLADAAFAAPAMVALPAERAFVTETAAAESVFVTVALPAVIVSEMLEVRALTAPSTVTPALTRTAPVTSNVEPSFVAPVIWALPATWSVSVGMTVPMPMFPVADSMKIRVLRPLVRTLLMAKPRLLLTDAKLMVHEGVGSFSKFSQRWRTGL